MNDPRDEMHVKAKKAFHAIPSKKASLEIGTGLGKSKIAIELVKEELENVPVLPEPRDGTVLILVDSERMRDTDWIEQCNKFGLNLGLVQIECYQTVYKWIDKYFYAVIADEWDFSLTEEYSKFYFNNHYTMLVAMTAYVDERKWELRDKIAPVCFKYSTQEGQRAGMLNKTKFYQVNFDLRQVKDIKVEMKKGGSFMQSETQAYLYPDQKFNENLIALTSTRKKLMKAEILGEETEELAKKVQNHEWGFKMFARKRQEVLHSLTSSKLVAQALITKIHEEPGNKILVFSKLTEQIDKITEHTYHGKNKNKKEEASKIDLLSAGSINTLGVCESITRGVNLVGVNVLIMESYIGGRTGFQQKHGRGVRLEVDDLMSYFILVPHVWDRLKKVNEETGRVTYDWIRRPTQAYHWFKEMTSEFDMTDLKIIEMKYDKLRDSYSIPAEYDHIFKRS